MINFAEVEHRVKALKQQLVENQIDEKSFENRLLELIDVASDGYYWMYGHESEQWFRHDGEKWIPDDPSRISANQNQAKRSPGAEPSPHENPVWAEESPVSVAWFVASLALLALIGWIVYVSSLV